MKKSITIILITLILNSCNRDYKKIEITDFSKIKRITLKPYQYKPYAMLKIKVKGFSNDTIRISYNLFGKLDFYLAGKFDTLLVSTDYYGKTPVIFIFDPYKSRNGKIEMEIKL